ncbi:50S ribosomal protein L21 [Rhodovulum sp. 12E13]|uniref:50S ribosomal protein L21 n=1 Tax=Rhodovulum sp. 12E13 TaxID=2203891 RepID=UPI000E19C354|nr:50S ribosomal protein L21 [Rhodovulum sp. 12E13]RDC74398.1 50S ribosomal protein L21 [Rhodovulum sp. 12E13]
MFAVMKTGGKQYRVQPGDVLRVEKLAADAGETIQFNEVLMVGATVGTPLVEGAGVQAEVIDQIKGEKLIHYVRRRRKHSSARKKGHRQQLTLLRITEILESGAGSTGVKAAIGAGSVPRDAAAPAPKAAAKAPKAESAAAPSADSGAAAGSKPGNLLGEPRDGTADNLKKIGGLGPKAAEALNAAGVFHFDQLASWSEAEIAYMEAETGLKGKIAAWADEARGLEGEKE